MKNNNLIKVTSDEGQFLSVVGDTYRLVITGKETNGAYAMIDMLVPPGAGPGPHSHADFQESFYVLDGEVEIKTEHETFIAKKGSFVNIPLGGLVHCFKNISDQNARLLCTVVPSGLEEFFLEIGEPVASGTFLPAPEFNPEKLESIKAIAEKYGQRLYPPDYLDK